jgi:hypothetical protein
MFYRAADVMPACCGREMPRRQSDATHILLGASTPDSNLATDRLTVPVEFGSVLGFIIVSSDDNVAALSPLGVKPVVVDCPPPDRVVLMVDLRHQPFLSPVSSLLSELST